MQLAPPNDVHTQLCQRRRKRRRLQLSERAGLVMTTLMLRYGRHGMWEHRIVVRGARFITTDPALGPNPQGDALVEAWIGRWVITYRRCYVRPREAMKGVRRRIPHQNIVLAAIFG